MIRIPTARTALLVVDMQNGFCHPDGSFGKAGADVSGCADAIPGSVALIEAAHAAGVPVYATRAIHEPGLADWNMLAELPMYAGLVELGSCEEGTWDAAFVDGLPLDEQDRIYSKSRFSPFVETTIDADLRAAGIENLVTCGVGTSACVETTVRDASQRSYRTFIVAEGTGDISLDAHEHSLALMGSLFGYTVTLEDVLAAWSEGGGDAS
ncbi:MAG: cysteine hydrolase [Cryobacterium sp.]|nr:cysteine hydrolase [Cryobacterium sp.]